ncbi:MAG: D-alanyl-D-alanine carboxypeptidase [Ignavibacteria bacterium]|nr:D-alanyl-D-alanine carboxypeptidase [Ignavibacteria bacterium]
MKIKTILLIFVSCFFINADSYDDIKTEINNVLNKLPAGTRIGMLVYNPLTRDTIYSINHTESMIPASNTKLFTTATALEIMGGSYTLSTQILTDDNDLTDGKIDGNIYIKGLGNSVFTSEDLIDMATGLYELGIKQITGNVIGDDTFFDNVYTRDDWIKDERANVKLAPISALVIDRNKTRVRKKSRGRLRTYTVNVTNPPLFAAKQLLENLSEAEIKVEGTAKNGETPLTAQLLLEEKIELRELIKIINKNSNNFLAECLFKTIGAVASSKQGNSFYSTQAILTFIEDNGIYSEGTSIVDGSGISRFDQITTGAIVGLLEIMYFDLKNFDDY